MNSYLWAPVVSGMWTQKELSDGTYDVEDLIEAHKVLRMREEMSRG